MLTLFLEMTLSVAIKALDKDLQLFLERYYLPSIETGEDDDDKRKEL
jgi:hypothetical protein